MQQSIETFMKKVQKAVEYALVVGFGQFALIKGKHFNLRIR
jgi:Flp pilus assembly pilin Flp